MNRSINVIIALLILTAASINPSIAQEREDLAIRPAIGGYSPVSYFTKNSAELGSPEFAVEHEGAVYHLTSQEQVEIFRKDPDRYRPRHRACPYSLAYGMVLPLDPTNFKIVGGSLLLFHRSEEKDALIEWNNSDLSEQELLRRAEANAFLVTF